MKRIHHRLLTLFALGSLLLILTGCANIMEEDPNSQQTPWGSPATWEGQVPGMPNQGF